MVAAGGVLAVLVTISSMGQGCRGSPEGVHYEPNWKLEEWNGRLPGFKARLTPQGFKFASTLARTLIAKEISKLDIPDMHGVTPVTYDVTNIEITQYTIGRLQINPVYTLGGVKAVQLSVQQLYITIIGDWDYHKLVFHGQGSFTAKAIDIELNLPIVIGVDQRGRLNLYTGTCDFEMGDFDLDLEDAGAIISPFKDKIVQGIKDALNSKVCSSLQEKINGDISYKIRNMPMLFSIKDVAVLDYSLVSAPDYNMINYAMETSHKGEVYAMDSTQECPLIIPPIPADTDNSTTHMLQMFITDYLPNSAGFALQNASILQYNVTQDNVPAAEKKYLNTSNRAFIILFPEISMKYKKVAIQINLVSTKAPSVVITPNGIKAVFVGEFSPYAVLPNNHLDFLFTMAVTINTDLTISTRNNSLVWEVSKLSTKLSLLRSAVGYIPRWVLEKEINTAIRFYFIKKLNKYGAKGIPLPQMEGFSLSNTVLKLGESYVKIETDVKYSG